MVLNSLNTEDDTILPVGIFIKGQRAVGDRSREQLELSVWVFLQREISNLIESHIRYLEPLNISIETKL